MPHCQHSNVVAVSGTVGETLRGVCLFCATCGPEIFLECGEQAAITAFHKKHPKETEMSQVTSDYRRGVEDALKLPLTFVGDYTAGYLRDQLEQQRKKLLTKKVTKWYNLYSDGEKVIVGQRDLYNSKERAECNSHGRLESLSYIGTFPVETIVEL